MVRWCRRGNRGVGDSFATLGERIASGPGPACAKRPLCAAHEGRTGRIARTPRPLSSVFPVPCSLSWARRPLHGRIARRRGRLVCHLRAKTGRRGRRFQNGGTDGKKQAHERSGGYRRIAHSRGKSVCTGHPTGVGSPETSGLVACAVACRSSSVAGTVPVPFARLGAAMKWGFRKPGQQRPFQKLPPLQKRSPTRMALPVGVLEFTATPGAGPHAVGAP